MKSSVVAVGHFVAIHSKDSLFVPGGQDRASSGPPPHPCRWATCMDDFYNRLAPLYDLIFPDWDASIERQAGQLAGIIQDRWGTGATTGRSGARGWSSRTACGTGTGCGTPSSRSGTSWARCTTWPCTSSPVDGGDRPATHVMRSKYYAIGAERLLDLMRRAGFASVER